MFPTCNLPLVTFHPISRNSYGIFVHHHRRTTAAGKVLLAASELADAEQAQLTHAVHPQAKQVRHFVQPFASHPAVSGANEALLNGVPLTDLFSAALRCTWPDFTPTLALPNVLKINDWVQSLADFARETSIESLFWAPQTAVWQEAQAALQTIFPDDRLLRALGQLGCGGDRPLLSCPTWSFRRSRRW